MTDRDRNYDSARDDDARFAGDRTGRAADKAFGSHDEPATTGDVVGEATGGIAGAATGAAIGSLGGPIGTIIGGIAGAVGGWWAGRAISEAASTYTEDDDAYYRSQFESRRAGGALRPEDADASYATSSSEYDAYRPAYQLGHLAAHNPDYANRDFSEVENELRTGWTDDVSRRYGDWNDVREHARSGFERGRESRLTLSREELDVGKQRVEAGEAKLRKTVETEHVRETVPLQREEVHVERRPIDASSAAAGDVRIGEEEIRVPLSREEAVVEKRAVPVEEVVVRKDLVTEERAVEADLRRERLDDSGLADVRDRSGGAMSRGADRLADKLDDVKDRVDGNPASRPGRDATDREAR
jgi:uncharacterized protein (TIGR02271 family)